MREVAPFTAKGKPHEVMVQADKPESIKITVASAQRRAVGRAMDVAMEATDIDTLAAARDRVAAARGDVDAREKALRDMAREVMLRSTAGAACHQSCSGRLEVWPRRSPGVGRSSATTVKPSAVRIVEMKRAKWATCIATPGREANTIPPSLDGFRRYPVSRANTWCLGHGSSASLARCSASEMCLHRRRRRLDPHARHAPQLRTGRRFPRSPPPLRSKVRSCIRG